MEDVKIHLYLNPFLSIYSLNGRACLQSNIVYSRCTVEEWCGCSVDRTTEHVNEQVRECTNEYSEEKEGSQSQVQSVFAVCVLADDECALCPSERVRWEQKVESEIWKNNKERNEDNFKWDLLLFFWTEIGLTSWCKLSFPHHREHCLPEQSPDAPPKPQPPQAEHGAPCRRAWPTLGLRCPTHCLNRLPRQDSAREVYD
jgi:hypothetical protein